MAIKYPDILNHNNPNYALVDAADVRGGIVAVTDKNSRNSIPIDKRQIHMLVSYVDSDVVTARYEGPTVEDIEWIKDSNWVTLTMTPDLVNFVTGPEDAIDNTLPRFNGVTGKLIKNSNVVVDDVGKITNHGTQSYFHTFNTTPNPDPNPALAVPITQGTMSWDELHRTVKLQIGLNGLGPTLQLGQELYVLVYNGTGVTIPNGKAVYILGVDTHAPAIALAKSDAAATASIVGMTTEEIAAGSYGMVAKYGLLHDYDTTRWAPGDHLFVSESVAGDVDILKPLPPSYTIGVAIVMDIGINGSIFIDPTLQTTVVDIVNAAVASGDPTGWLNNDDIAIVYNSTTRTVTLTGDIRYAYRGYIVTLPSPWESPAHPDIRDQSYFLYSTDGETFIWTTEPWGFKDIMTAFIFYGTDYSFGLSETHGTMGWQTHEEFHQLYGTYRQSGGTLSDYTLDSNLVDDKRPDVSVTVVKDEDNRTTLSALTSKIYAQGYLANISDVVFASSLEIVPLSGTRPFWNEWDGAAWLQTPMDNNTYMSVWVIAAPVTADAESYDSRYLWVQGQASSASFTVEDTRNPQDLSLGNLGALTPEYVFITQIIIRYTGGTWSISEVKVLSGSKATFSSAAGGAFLSAVSHDATLTGTGTSGDPLSVVQQEDEDVALSANIIATVAAGGVEVGDTFEPTNSLRDLWLALIAPYVKPILGSIIISPGATVEVGATITMVSATLTWTNDSETNPPINAVITGPGFGAVGLTASGQVVSAIPLTDVQKLVVSSQIWTFSATDKDAIPITSKTDVVYWYNRLYYGNHTSAALSEAELESLGSILRVGYAGNYSFPSGVSVYKWICVVDSEAQPTEFKDDGTNLPVPFNAAITVAITNAHGVALNVECYRSVNQLSGAIVIKAI